MGTKYQGTEEATRALDTYIKLMRASESLTNRIHRHLHDVDLTISQFGVLEALLHLGSLCQSELAHKLLRTGGNMTLVIDNLEKRDLVRRERSSIDRRFISVHLTDAGRTLIERIFPRHVEAVTQAMERLDAEEQEMLSNLCRKLGSP